MDIRKACAVLAVLGAGLAASEAAAHPHVFAEARVEIVGAGDGTLAAVRNVWRMDELFSSTVLVEFDENADGALDPAELGEVGHVIHESLADYSYYTYVRAGGRPVDMVAPDQIRALFENGQLLLFFEMRPDEPIDLAAQPVSVANFDETFYTAFDHSGEEAFVLVDMPPSCGHEIVVPDEDEAARQWLEMIAALGPEESVPADGAKFAQVMATRVKVTCA